MALRSTQALTACNSRRSKLTLLQVGLNAASLAALQQFGGRAERLFAGAGVQRRSGPGGPAHGAVHASRNAPDASFLL